VCFAEQTMGARLVRRLAQDRHHLRADLVVTLQGEQGHPEQETHLGHGRARQENAPTRANRLLVAPLRDQRLGARGQVLDRGRHRECESRLVAA
jgi:hypothetical protein